MRCGNTINTVLKQYAYMSRHRFWKPCDDDFYNGDIFVNLLLTISQQSVSPEQYYHQGTSNKLKSLLSCVRGVERGFLTWEGGRGCPRVVVLTKRLFLTSGFPKFRGFPGKGKLWRGVPWVTFPFRPEALGTEEMNEGISFSQT